MSLKEINFQDIIKYNSKSDNCRKWISYVNLGKISNLDISNYKTYDLLRLSFAIYILELFTKEENSYKLNIDIDKRNISTFNRMKDFIERFLQEKLNISTELNFNTLAHPYDDLEIYKLGISETVLYSGGTDSYLNSISSNKKKILINIATSPLIRKKINSNFQKDRKLQLTNILVIHNSIINSKYKLRFNRIPKMLYTHYILSAAALSYNLGIFKLIIPNCGITFLNPVFSDLFTPDPVLHSLTLPFVTKFLELYFQGEVEMRFPQIKNTRAEMIRKIRKLIIPNHINSCFRFRKQTLECGICFNCLHRRLSFSINDINEDQKFMFHPFGLGNISDEIISLDPQIMEDNFFYFKFIDDLIFFCVKIVINDKKYVESLVNKNFIPKSVKQSEIISSITNFASDTLLGFRKVDAKSYDSKISKLKLPKEMLNLLNSSIIERKKFYLCSQICSEK